MRLIYVALTRAIYRSYLIAGVYSNIGKNGPTYGESSRSLLNWLACGQGVVPEDWIDSKKKVQHTPESILEAWQSLTEETGAEVSPSLLIDPLPVLAQIPQLTKPDLDLTFSARKLSRPAGGGLVSG